MRSWPYEILALRGLNSCRWRRVNQARRSWFALSARPAHGHSEHVHVLAVQIGH